MQPPASALGFAISMEIKKSGKIEPSFKEKFIP